MAPEARGLFRRAGLLSGPCLGGPPGRGWGPGGAERGRAVAEEVLEAHGARTLDELRGLPAEQVQWPGEYMTDLAKAPFFSGYFYDAAVLPDAPEALWRRGEIHPEEYLMIHLNY